MRAWCFCNVVFKYHHLHQTVSHKSNLRSISLTAVPSWLENMSKDKTKDKTVLDKLLHKVRTSAVKWYLKTWDLYFFVNKFRLYMHKLHMSVGHVNSFRRVVSRLPPTFDCWCTHHICAAHQLFHKKWQENCSLSVCLFVCSTAKHLCTHIRAVGRCENLGGGARKALTKYERPKIKRDARQKCSLFPQALVIWRA